LRADVTGDNVVNAADAISIINVLNARGAGSPMTVAERQAAKWQDVLWQTIFADANRNVGIAAPDPLLDIPAPPNGNTTGNINANDLYLRSVSAWASQLGGGGGVPTRIIPTLIFARGGCGWSPYEIIPDDRSDNDQYVTVSYPEAVPATAAGIVMKVYAQSNSSGCWLWAKAPNFPEDIVVASVALNNSDDMASDTTTVVMPYENSRTMDLKWRYFKPAGGGWIRDESTAGIRAFVVGYIE